jgi:hypothetical protein
VRHLEAKISDHQKQNEEIEEKRVIAKKETVRAEIKLQHVLRDLELKDIQIANLKSVWLKSEQDFDKLLKDMNKWESDTAGATGKMKKAEYEKNKLIEDNVSLLNENEQLRAQLLNFTFMKSNSESHHSANHQ